LKFIAGHRSVRNLLEKYDAPLAKEVEQLFENGMALAFYYNTYFVSNLKGTQLVKVYKDKTIQVRYADISQRDYIKRALKGQSVIAIINSIITNRPILNFSLPVYNKRNRIIGVQSALMEVERFGEIIQNLSFTEHSEGFILNEEGMIVAHRERKYILQNNFFKDVKFDKKTIEYIRQHQSGFIPFVHKDEKQYFYFQKIKKMNWIVGYNVPEGDFYSHIKQIKYFILVLTIIMLGVAIFLALIFARVVTNPVQSLKGGFAKVQEGNFDFRLTECKASSKNEMQMIIKAFNTMVNSLKEKERIKDAFGKYVSKQILEKITTESINLGGETKEVTILFSDIRGFTKMSEKMQPQEIVDFLNNYFSKMVEAIFKYEGIVDKFIGDGIMAIFGAPIYHPDDPKRAIAAALEMNAGLSDFNAQRNMRGLEPINIGIAVHTGDCLVGNIGTKDKMEFTAIGDTVNLTSRMESLNKQFHTNIIISERTYEYVKDFIEVRILPKTRIRGKEDIFQFYELVRFTGEIKF
jgi:adenylate cyclase